MVQMENDKVSPATRAEHSQHFANFPHFLRHFLQYSELSEEFHSKHKAEYWLKILLETKSLK